MLDTTGNCSNIAESGDVTDYFIQEKLPLLDNKELQADRAKEEGKSVLTW